MFAPLAMVDAQRGNRPGRAGLGRLPLRLPGGSPNDSIFAIPLLNYFIIHAPLHHLAALVDRRAVLSLRDNLRSGGYADRGQLGQILHVLNHGAALAPLPRQGELAPAFLGLLPTRACNLSCQYCGFVVHDAANQVMDLKLACAAVDWYMDLASQSGLREVEVHYFGGEPFCAEELLDVTVHLARRRARERDAKVRFEVATNGVLSEKRCQSAADNMDTIVLSLDGPAPIQDRQRPYRDGRGSFEVVDRSARILSEGAAQLFFRVCVTAQTVGAMPEIAAWLCQNYRPHGVCFEPVQPPGQAGADQLEPPDAWQFAYNFIRAAPILETHGVEPVYTAADVRAKRVSFCPAGQDVVIVSPDGVISACYLLRRDWEARGMDLCLGRMRADGLVELDEQAVAFARSLNVWNKPFCANCFCKWHCAGGCHVNHRLPDTPGDYDRLCVQTRIITVRNILKAMGREELMLDLLADDEALGRAICQVSDTLVDGGERL